MPKLSKWRQSGSLKVPAKLLKSLEGILSLFSKCALKSLNNQTDFDSAIRRFDPSRPSQPFRCSARLSKRREDGPEIRASRASNFVSGLPVCRYRGRHRRKSPALSGNIPVLGRLWAETGLISTATAGGSHAYAFRVAITSPFAILQSIHRGMVGCRKG